MYLNNEKHLRTNHVLFSMTIVYMAMSSGASRISLSINYLGCNHVLQKNRFGPFSRIIYSN